MIVMSVIYSVPDRVEANRVIVAFRDLLKDSLEDNWDEQRTIIASHDTERRLTAAASIID
jgi:hypothetical protein